MSSNTGLLEKDVQEDLTELEAWGFQKTNKPVPAIIRNKMVSYSDDYDGDKNWRVSLLFPKGQITQQNPHIDVICFTYNTINEAMELIKSDYELLDEEKSQKIGVVIQDKKRKEFYTGYLSPLRTPESWI